MRQITGHIVNPANDKLTITVRDLPGHGGACHRYDIGGFDTNANPSKAGEDGYGASYSMLPIIFQNGPVSVDGNGVNGITHEALLAILIDRLEGFQAGPYANPHNAKALNHLREAQTALQARTRERMARGVEGTHTV